MVVGQLGKTMTLKISNKYIGTSFPTYFIAEAGLNHNGDVNLAKKMIDEAKNANSDAIKFQTYKSENFLTENSKYFDFFKNVELSFEEFKEIKEYADNVGITFLSTPFDFESADYLNKIDVPGFKIASSDVTNLPLIAHIAKMKLPIILSTGLATLDEIDESIKLCHSLQNDQISILHCVADYPAIPEETNLSAMETIREKFCFPVGYSDNGESSLVDEVAVSMGADIIEKHFTLDKNMPGPDQKLSLNLNELSELVKGCKAVKLALGNSKRILAKEKPILKFARESIVSLKKISKGEKFSEKNISTKRPATGDIPAKDYYKIIGRSAKRNISDNIQLSQNDVY